MIHKRYCFYTAVLFFSLSCSSGAYNFKFSEVTTDGWIDYDTFRISAEGKSESDDYNIRHDSAEQSAVQKAQKKLKKKFNLLRQDNSDINNNPTEIALQNELMMIIISGKVIEKNFDEKKGLCDIIYEIKSKGLKDKVEAAHN